MPSTALPHTSCPLPTPSERTPKIAIEEASCAGTLATWFASLLGEATGGARWRAGADLSPHLTQGPHKHLRVTMDTNPNAVHEDLGGLQQGQQQT